jgi:hypothetical protein
MPITRTPMIDDDGSGTTGTIINNAWKQELYGQIDAFADGVWVDIPFNAANYSVAQAQGSGTWTVEAADQITFRRVILNQKTWIITFVIGPTITTGTATVLDIKVPGLVNSNKHVGVPMFYWGDISGSISGFCEIQPSGTSVRLMKDIGGTPWGANSFLYFEGQIIIGTT